MQNQNFLKSDATVYISCLSSDEMEIVPGGRHDEWIQNIMVPWCLALAKTMSMFFNKIWHSQNVERDA